MANTKTGRVLANNCDKTITVQVVTYKNHPLYKKRYIYSKKYLVHDPSNQAQVKDTVVIKQSRPISRRKRWILEKVVVREGKPVQNKNQKAASSISEPKKKTPLKRKPATTSTKKPASKAKKSPVAKK